MLASVACALALLAFVEGDVIVYTQTIPHTIADEFRDMPASFGNEIPPDGLRGYLTVAEPSNACSPINKPPASDNFTKRWIVLIARYNCSFEVKIRNAQAAGYDCAIVHNVDSNDLETMSAKNSEGIDIPSVFVTAKAGFILSEEYLYTNGYYIMVNGDPPFNINTHLLLPFAIVVALCLVVMLIFMIVKCIRDRRRARRHRLPSRALKKIPTCKFSKGDPYDTCAICLDDYLEGDRLRVLPCAHAYHAKCIDPWLTQNRRVCPVCKRRVLAAGERRAHSDSDDDDDESREPLVTPTRPDAHRTPTQGGTFEEQSENPFVRAARFMSRLRGRTADAVVTEDTPSSEENDQSNINEGTVHEEDSQPLIRPTVTSEAERRPRRARRQRSASSPRTRTRTRDSPPAPDADQHQHQHQQLLRSADHSINRPSRGEIGVAALPAPDSHHVDL